MRSRFSAYALGDTQYLKLTWHRDTRPRRLDLDGSIRWVALTVRRTEFAGDEGLVEFDAAYRVDGGTDQVMHEISRFVREQGRWLYVDALTTA